MFEIQDKVANIDDWGEVNQIFVTSNNRGQGQPNKVERDFTNPMRIIGKTAGFILKYITPEDYMKNWRV